MCGCRRGFFTRLKVQTTQFRCLLEIHERSEVGNVEVTVNYGAISQSPAGSHSAFPKCDYCLCWGEPPARGHYPVNCYSVALSGSSGAQLLGRGRFGVLWGGGDGQSTLRELQGLWWSNWEQLYWANWRCHPCRRERLLGTGPHQPVFFPKPAKCG